MTRDEVIALASDVSGEEWTGPEEFLAFLDRFAAAIEARVRESDPALRLVADIRFALGDDGKRMSDELVEYCRELQRDAERYRWLRDASMDERNRIEHYAGHALDAAIDAAMQTQAPTGA